MLPVSLLTVRSGKQAMSTVRSWSSQVSCPLSHATRPSRKLRNPLETPPPPRTAVPLILMRRHAAAASVVPAPARGSTTPEACHVAGSFCSATHRPRSEENGGAGSRRYEQAALWRSEGCSAMEHGPRGWPAAHVCGATNRPRRRDVKATRTGGTAAPCPHAGFSASHASRACRSTECRTQPELTPNSRRQQCSRHFPWRKGGHWSM
jgi:hypothetical protein